MDRRQFPIPGTTKYLPVDLDDREPLTDLEVDALSQALHYSLQERQVLNQKIRKISQRLVLSGEEKLKEEEDGA
jgi:hypothetical protein